METPTSIGEIDYDIDKSRGHIKQAIDEKKNLLNTHEVKPILECYGLNVMPTWLASDASEAAQIAEQVGYPVAVKLSSQDIQHKSAVHGVMLDLNNSAEVANAVQMIMDRVSISYPSAHIDGLQIQSMANRAGAHEIKISVRKDPVFGPIILIGEGGQTWDMNKDAAVAIPPLNMTLARYLVISAIKSGKIRPRNHPTQLDMDSLCHFLVTLSQIIIDCPEISSLDIDPLMATGTKLTVLDCSMTLDTFDGDIQQRLAIRPYPKELEENGALRDGRKILLRPILPEDEPFHKAFVEKVSVEDLYKRFFSDVGELNHEALANLTQIDYDREMAFLAVCKDDHIDHNEILGVVRALANPEHTEAEFAVLVRSDLKGMGLGNVLMNKIIDYAKQSGIRHLTGMTMPSNQGMVALAQKLGFEVDVQFQDGTVDLKLVLD